MIRLKNYIALILSCLAITTFAQNGKLVFDTLSHDFGNIKEIEGPVSHTFTFKNEGTSPLTIKKVDVSCGCTTPDWTQDPVAPGESGFIKAEFDPSNKPGEFEKYLTVHTDGTPDIEEIVFKGFVEPKPEEPQDAYPYEYGSIRLKDRNLKIGLITTEKPVFKEFEIYNPTDEEVTIDATKLALPEHIKVHIDKIPPKQAGTLELVYDPKVKNDYGSYLRDKINIPLTTGLVEKNLTVITSIEEYFPEMDAAALAKSPKISFSKSTIELPSIKAGELMSATITVTNTGKEPLILRKVYSSCKCIEVKAVQNTIQPNQSTQLNIKFDSSSRSGKQKKKILIYANAPEQPYSELLLTATVVD